MKDNKFHGGAFLLARKLFNSEIWLRKPSSWKIIWVYIIGKVNHTDNEVFKRGEGFFNFTEERRRIGIDITPDMVKKFLVFARRTSMIDTKRSTRGVIVKVLSYKDYQEFKSYRSTAESTREAREKHERSTPISNNVNNDKNEKNVNNGKTKFLDFVYLTQQEHSALVARFGEHEAAERIKNLNDYVGAKGDKYKSHYHTIMMWDRKDRKERKFPQKVTV